ATDSPRTNLSPQHTPPPHTPLLFLFATPTTPNLSTLSLHDALPICCDSSTPGWPRRRPSRWPATPCPSSAPTATTCPSRSARRRSEEHTSELQSRGHLVCRLLLEKKK